MDKCSQQDRVAPLRGHLAKRPGVSPDGRGWRGDGAARAGRRSVQAVGTEVPQEGQLGYLGLDRLRRGRRGPVAQPYQLRYAQFRVGLDQGVQLCTTFGAEDRAEQAMDLFG